MLTQNDRLEVGCARSNISERSRTARVIPASTDLYEYEGRVAHGTYALSAHPRDLAARWVDSRSLGSLPTQRSMSAARAPRPRAPCIRSAVTFEATKAFTRAVSLKEDTAGNPAVMKLTLRRFENGQL